MHFGKEASRLRNAIKVTIRGVVELLGVGWLPHQPRDAFIDVLTAVFDRALVIVIPSHILESV